MELNRIKLGKYIEPFSEACNIPNLTVNDVSGVNRDKEFFEPSTQVGADTSKYKIVPPGYYACNLMHVGRDVVLPIAYNHSQNNKIVSPAYQVFRFVENDELLTEYFFLYLKSSEKDRYFWFNTDGSVRDGMSWNDFIDVEIELPSIDIQQKYVDVYNAMLENQKSYERGLEDLKLVCDSALDKIKEGNCIKLGKIIEKRDCKNIDNYLGKEAVRGITNKKQFDSTKADLRGTDLSKFLIVHKGEFAYNSRTDGRDMLVLALNREENSIIVTFNYNVFGIKDKMKNSVNTEFLYTLFKRTEFDRKVRFDSWGSSQELFSWESLCDLDIPFPSIEIQNSIASINEAYINRTNINEKLKSQIKTLCPILIKGSIEEAKRS